MTSHEKVSVVMPAYNEQEHIAAAIAETIAVLEKLQKDFEIIVVNDHSTDNTSHILQKLSSVDGRIREISNEGQCGKGAALAFGVQHVSGDVVFFLDADLDLPPSQLPVFFTALEDPHVDGVIGSKLHPESNVDFPPKRKLISRGYQLLTQLLFRLPYKDTQTGLKAFRRNVLDDVFPSIKTARYAYDLEMLLLMHQQNYVIVEVPVTVLFSRKEGSRIGIQAILSTLRETFSLWMRR